MMYSSNFPQWKFHLYDQSKVGILTSNECKINEWSARWHSLLAQSQFESCSCLILFVLKLKYPKAIYYNSSLLRDIRKKKTPILGAF